MTIANKLLKEAKGDSIYIFAAASADAGGLAVEESQDWEQEASFYRFSDESFIRVQGPEAEECSAEEFYASLAR